MLAVGAIPARAESAPWYEGRDGHRRLLHLSIAATLGLADGASETVLKTTFAPTQCRWCNPPGFDRAVRNALVWRNPQRAALLSSIDVFIVAPIVGFGLLIASDHDAGW